MEFNLLVAAFVYPAGYILVLYRELKFVRLYGGILVLRVVACLNHLALVGLEDKALFLEVVDIAFVGAFAIDEAKLKEHKNGNAYPR